MSDNPTIRKTPLHRLHVEAGARMVDFAGWSMPVQYSGVIEEHNAVRSAAGLFDVSHMGEVRCRGEQALDYLQRITCNNVSRLEPGRAHYNGLMTEQGCFVDDLLIYQLGQQDYLLIVNAANLEKDLACFRSSLDGFEATIADESEDWALLALQGPRAAEILGTLTPAALDQIKYYHFVQADVAGVRLILSRTGYTGEDGFELYTPACQAASVWEALQKSGKAFGLQSAGLAARDTLRLEASMALYGNDIDETTSALEADLGWIVKFKKGDFIGRDRLLEQKRAGVQRRLAGFEMLGRRPARQGYSALSGGGEVGRVTSGSFSPTLKKNIGLVYLPIELTEVGTEFEIDIRGRAEKARVVSRPFYSRKR